MSSIEIVVTQDDVDKALKAKEAGEYAHKSCPLVQAAIRFFGTEKEVVVTGPIEVGNKDEEKAYYHPENFNGVSNFMAAFDRGELTEVDEPVRFVFHEE